MMVEIKYLIFSFINFILFFLLLFFLLKKPLISFLAKRRNDYVEESKKWLDAVKAAGDQVNNTRSMILNIDQEGGRFLEQTEQEAKQAEAAAIDQAVVLAGNIKKDAERMSRAEAVSQSVKIKDGFISRLIKMTEEDMLKSSDKDLVSGYVAESASKARTGDVKNI